jgi:MHS family proline/betaine transporter-like MFS transporter
MKLIIAAVIGSIFELFDFVVFMFLLPILVTVFFPTNWQETAIWMTYLTVTVSYFLRPIGGVILGHMGDKYGRKSVFSFTLLIMSIPSLLLALLPTYNEMGYLAPVLLIIIRLFQGFALGGEVPGSITYVAEKFKSSNYFFACAWLTFGANLSVTIAPQFIQLLNRSLSHDFMYIYGWRIPFLLSGILAIIGMYIRKYTTESDQYLNSNHNRKRIPVVELSQSYLFNICTGVLLCVVVSTTTSIFHIFLPTVFVRYYNFNIADLAGISSLGAMTMALSSLFFSYITKYISPILIIRVSLLLLITLLFAISFNYFPINTLHNLYIGEFIISLLLAGVNGVFFGILADIFPIYVRYSGIAVSYNTAYILGAGIAPLWAEFILKNTHQYNLITIVCSVIALLSLLNTINLAKIVQYK